MLLVLLILLLSAEQYNYCCAQKHFDSSQLKAMSLTFEAKHQVACVRNLIKLKNKTKFSFHYKDPNHKGSHLKVLYFCGWLWVMR